MSKKRFRFQHRTFTFKTPAKTSRNTLYTKPSWTLELSDESGNVGYGECSLIPTLSPDDVSLIEQRLNTWSDDPSGIPEDLSEIQDTPALRFAMEMLLRSYHAEDPFRLFNAPFSQGDEGILMNGLIWMDSFEGVLQQIQDRVDEGFEIIKMKVGAEEFDYELDLLTAIRERFPSDRYELRLDANGAFTPENALLRLEKLAQFDIHSIEQPVKPRQWSAMRELTSNSPIPIALDEELISNRDKNETLEAIQPQYLILKPSLIGGWKESEEWIQVAKEHGSNWWATSALESNLGLNAIAQWCAVQETELPQGLGTGRLYTENIPCPLHIKKAHLWYGDTPWEVAPFLDAES